MRTPELIAKLLEEQERTYAWLARATGIEYKKLLRVAKHGTQTLSFLDGATIAIALGTDISALIPEKRQAVAA